MSRSRLPRPSDRRLAVRVTPDALRQVRARHPWVYDKSIVSVSHDGAPGDLAVLFDDDRQFAAIGLWDPTSVIRVRVLHAGRPTAIDRAFWAARLGEALARRAPLADRGDTTGYRLVHGENDRMPGLVLDRYDRTLVLKLYSVAWVPHLDDILAVVDEHLHPDAVVLRLGRSLPEAHLHGLEDGDVLLGTAPDGPVAFTEHGLWFEADVVTGQKTGHFLDQRDNRALVAGMVAGRRVLDLFASTGGFTVHAAAGGAADVVSVDLSAPTLAVAERNLARNAHLPKVAACTHRSIVGDAFEVLRELAAARERFDVVIIDPPAFASRADQVPAALRAYAMLTTLAMPVLRRGGLLVQCSCSSRVTADDLERAVTRAAGLADRPLRIERRTDHAIDHPIGFPEGAYLSALFARVP
ncbi:MAG: class I SAM-dependent rRNA methyltransferase [Ilumatobacteraceae bacterium]